MKKRSFLPKSHYIPHKNYFGNQSCSDSDISHEVLLFQVIKFLKYQVILKFHVELNEKCLKTVYTRDAISSELFEIFCSNSYTISSKSVFVLYEKFRFLSSIFPYLCRINGQRARRLGWFITDINNMLKNNNYFVLFSNPQNSIVSEISSCWKFCI